MTTDFFGMTLAFVKNQKVMVKSAEVVAEVIGIRVNTLDEEVEYLISFPYGSVYVEEQSDLWAYVNSYHGSYDHDCAWAKEEDIIAIEDY